MPTKRKTPKPRPGTISYAGLSPAGRRRVKAAYRIGMKRRAVEVANLQRRVWDAEQKVSLSAVAYKSELARHGETQKSLASYIELNADRQRLVGQLESTLFGHVKTPPLTLAEIIAAVKVQKGAADTGPTAGTAPVLAEAKPQCIVCEGNPSPEFSPCANCGAVASV